MAEQAVAALELPPGWSAEELEFINGYACPKPPQGAAAACRFVVVNENGKMMYETDAQYNGPGKVHKEAELPQTDEHCISNGDAERKAITDLLWQISAKQLKASTFRFVDGSVLFVLGNIGPCRGCKKVLAAFGAKHNLIVKYVYLQCTENKTVGGVNGFPDAVKIKERFFRVQGATGLKPAEMPAFAKKFLEDWEDSTDRSNLRARANMLSAKDLKAIAPLMAEGEYEELIALRKG